MYKSNQLNHIDIYNNQENTAASKTARKSVLMKLYELNGNQVEMEHKQDTLLPNAMLQSMLGLSVGLMQNTHLLEIHSQ